MDKYEYQILTGRDRLDVPGGVMWYTTNNLEAELGPELPSILNKLGSQGWEITSIGDISYSKRSEIVLKRRSA